MLVQNTSKSTITLFVIESMLRRSQFIIFLLRINRRIYLPRPFLRKGSMNFDPN
ncbi:hypothetical protein MA16_Dca014281 [Dendrobium catenatum]|uniref:Uncharacterized protein n=1 Tax=Dendrobium catenatum TaxID=906689 RepID=A0A2I0VJZ1_9ASPA|nr:hypothetical protein MA16_Dca014281 [Dendrobium catenatum]